jgi:hypothetical protein
MKTILRVVPTVALVAALITACSQASPTSPSLGLSDSGLLGAGGAPTVPLKGSLEGTTIVTPLNPPFASVVVTASGNATQLGRFTLQLPHVVNFATRSAEGTFTFTAANGDRLTGVFTGQADTTPPIFKLEERGTITGGTGRFAEASGTIAIHRLFDPAAGTTTGTIEGTLTF